MNTQAFIDIIIYVVNQGLTAIKANTQDVRVVIDYVALFSKNKEEYNKFVVLARLMGEEVDKSTVKTGHTFFLHKPIETPAGLLRLIKIRLPDPTRPQRGAPDFKIDNYYEFKNKYIKSSGNFTLMLKEEYEMIEIKGVDVLVYIPNNTLGERMKKK